MGTAQFVLEKALCLGRRARKEGWDANRLAKVFAKFAREQKKLSGRGKNMMVEGKLL